MMAMGDWRTKADEDLTVEDFAEMRRLAVPVDVRLTPHVPGGGQFVERSRNANSAALVLPSLAGIGVSISIYPSVHQPA